VTQEGGLYHVTLSGAAEMRTFLRTLAEPFEATVKRFAEKSGLAVVINGNMYAFSGGVLSLLGTPDASQTTPEGVVQGRGRVLGGVSEPQMFYVAWHEGAGYRFGFGDPPGDATSALGGLGPVLLNGLKYGSA